MGTQKCVKKWKRTIICTSRVISHLNISLDVAILVLSLACQKVTSPIRSRFDGLLIWLLFFTIATIYLKKQMALKAFLFCPEENHIIYPDKNLLIRTKNWLKQSLVWWRNNSSKYGLPFSFKCNLRKTISMMIKK